MAHNFSVVKYLHERPEVNLQSINTALAFRFMQHQLALLQLGASEAQEFLQLNEVIDLDLVGRLNRLPEGKAGRRALESWLLELQAVSEATYINLEEFLKSSLLSIAQYEQEFNAKIIKEAFSPAEVSWLPLTAGDLEQVITAEPFAGRLLGEWVGSLRQEKFSRIREKVRAGLAEGQGIAEISQSVRGTKKAQYKDGALEIMRRHAETVARTAVTAAVNLTRKSLYRENADIIKAAQWHAIEEQTQICVQRNGKCWNVTGEFPVPPAHPNCRSFLAPVLLSWKELNLDATEVSQETLEAFDGSLPAIENILSEFLAGKSKEFLEEVLGNRLADKYINAKDTPILRALAKTVRPLEEIRSLQM